MAKSKGTTVAGKVTFGNRATGKQKKHKGPKEKKVKPYNRQGR